MKKILILLLMITSLVGCTNDSKQTSNTESITITHELGTVTAPTNISKAAVFDFGALDIIDNLDSEIELMLPVDNLPEYLKKYSSAKNAGAIKEPDLEALYTFEPDVIIISGRQQDYFDELNKIAPTIYITTSPDTYTQDVSNNTKMIATLLGKENEANLKIEEIENQIEITSNKIKELNQNALILLTNNGSISAYGKGSRFSIIHDVLHFNTADNNIEVSTHGQKVNFEYIAQVNPDYLFIIDRTDITGGNASGTDTLNNDLVNSTNAAKNNHITYLTSDYWYLSTGGLTSTLEMIKEIDQAVSK